MIKFLQLLLTQRSSLSAPVHQPKIDDAESCTAHLYMANMYVSMGQSDRAEEEYLRAYKFRPSAEIRDLIENLRRRRVIQKRSQTVATNTRISRAA